MLPLRGLRLPLLVALSASSAGCGLLWVASPPSAGQAGGPDSGLMDGSLTDGGLTDGGLTDGGLTDGSALVDAPPGPDASWFPGEWVSLSGGSFLMGSDTHAGNERPAHEVTMPSYQISRTEVTVAEYLTCVRAGSCSEPGAWGDGCYWRAEGYQDYPVNCVSWRQAIDYCTWAGGRLTSEAEWEYAARSMGDVRTYPWGEEPATCDYAVMNVGGSGCGTGAPWAVCSRPMGNTDQGLCDMAGNLMEWMLDGRYGSYVGAPTDGSAWEGGRGPGYARGGNLLDGPDPMRTTHRGNFFGDPENYNNTFIGFRCARDAP